MIYKETGKEKKPGKENEQSGVSFQIPKFHNSYSYFIYNKRAQEQQRALSLLSPSNALTYEQVFGQPSTYIAT